MPVSVETRGGETAVFLSGEVDHHGARALMAALDDTIATLLPMRLILDLSGVTFMDSSGIAVLLRANRQMALHGGAVRVRAIPPQPRKVLDAAGLGRILTLE